MLMRVPEAAFIKQIDDNLGKEQTLTSREIMMYNISTKTGESSLFPGYKFTVRYEEGKYKLTITRKVDEVDEVDEVCGRVPEKMTVLPHDIRGLKKGKSKTYSQALMHSIFDCKYLVEDGSGLSFYGYPDYTIKYNPASNNYTITKLY